MPKNPFNFKDEHVEKPLRSNFDLSHNNHLSVGFGKIVPVFCEQCYPGDSFDIKAAFGLDAMPMVFPVQSSVRAHLHFYWIPNRILWKDWEDFYGGTAADDVVPPYIDLSTSTEEEINFAKKFFSSGSLADYLDVPTTYAGFYGRGRSHSFEPYDGSEFRFIPNGLNVNPSNHVTAIDSITSGMEAFAVTPFYFYGTYRSSRLGHQNDVLIHVPTAQLSVYGPDNTLDENTQFLSDHIHPISNGAPLPGSSTQLTSYGLGFLTKPFMPSDGTIGQYFHFPFNNGDVPIVLGDYSNLYMAVYEYYDPHHPISPSAFNSQLQNMDNWRLISIHDGSSDLVSAESNSTAMLSLPAYLTNRINSSLLNGRAVRLVIYQLFDASGEIHPKTAFDTTLSQPNIGTSFIITKTTEEVVDLSDEDISLNPFVKQDGSIPRPISSLPFRAYEAVCNCYYRNNQVDPFILNGRPVYNKYITNDNGGSDNTPYDFFFRNWELDAYTGCLPSPQQGIAPLVGMTALGDVTITDENGITTAQAEIDNDGTITNVVLTSPAASNEHARTAMNIAAAGMSINDFRSTNALQRSLEKSIRRGYRYAEQILSHFGVEPKYSKLDMPVFIGGVSKSIDVNKVLNTAQSADNPLGSFAGIANIMGAVNHNIRHFCDEHGFILGVMCITPTPSYSQLLPKHYTFLNNRFDYFDPDFARIGMQPITYDEVCPIQAYGEEVQTGRSVLHKTFGYQRPYHEMVRRVDTVHSLLRTSLRNYLINRLFASRPELGHDFISCNPAECNDVFAVQLPNDDKFVGQVSLQIYAKRPLPRTSMPCLE